MCCPPFRLGLIYSDLQEAREEERRREGRGEEQRVDKLGNYSSITGFATIRQVRGGGRWTLDNRNKLFFTLSMKPRLYGVAPRLSALQIWVSSVSNIRLHIEDT
jgi:hypothetical protein